jgi:membrane associated rhomboid family serine protease
MSWQAADDTEYPRMTRTVQVLIAVNIAVAFLTATIVPEELAAVFAFRPGSFGDVWWSAITYMFLHAGLLHLAFNLYTLWVFGPRLEHVWGPRSFALFFLWCGIGGAAFHALLGGGSSMIGASAAIYGVMTAYATHWPREEVYLFGVLPMRVATMVGIFVAFDLVRGITGGSGVAYFAHLGGVAFALLFLKRPQHVSIEQLRQRVSAAPDINDDMTPRAAPKSTQRTRQRDEVDEIVAQSKAAVAKSAARVGTEKAAPVRETRAEEMNRLLDKIARTGLDSLTVAERKFLDEVSRELRDQ